MDTHTEVAPEVTEAPVDSSASANPLDGLPDASEPAPAFAFNEALENALNPPTPSDDGEPEGSEEITAEETGTPAVEEVLTDDSHVSDYPADLLEKFDGDQNGDWTPKAAIAFQRMKASNKNLSEERVKHLQKIEEYESRLLEFEGIADNKDVDALHQRIKEFEDSQMLSDLEATASYKASVTEPMQAILDRVNEIATAYEAPYEEILDTLFILDDETQDEKIKELMPTASDRDRATLYRLAADLDPILDRRDQLREDVDAALREANLVQEQREKAEAATRFQNRANATRTMSARMVEKLPLIVDIEGVNMEDLQTKAAQADPQAVHPVDFAYSSLAGQLFPHIIRELISSQKETDALTAKLAEYDSVEPSLSGRPASSLPSGSKASESSGFAEALESQLGAL
ncbi:MAG: hypothetical protein CMA72_07740 [Euryarchaeota archaeon]|nr:hypothetical protein [Euryarchaeota archaeon]|tara:strand:- start:2392 stop:3600 length:1209 start_codon:yes stop_codon:yes gene_type:complete